MNRLPFEILHEDRELIVIDKPAGLLTTHTRLLGRFARETQPTAENFLNDYVRKGQAKSRKRVWLVHRLDRETSGVMMFAKSEEVAERFRSDWNAMTEKTYLARVEGVLAEDRGVFESYLAEDADGYKVRSVLQPREKIGGESRWRKEDENPFSSLRTSRHPNSQTPKLARTEWRKLSVEDGTTLVEVVLKSGRKNQIRVHFSEAGCPVVGDEKYGGPKASRMYLHAWKLAILRNGKRDCFESVPPKGFAVACSYGRERTEGAPFHRKGCELHRSSNETHIYGRTI